MKRTFCLGFRRMKLAFVAAVFAAAGMSFAADRPPAPAMTSTFAHYVLNYETPTDLRLQQELEAIDVRLGIAVQR